jgi:hypothetical protein
MIILKISQKSGIPFLPFQTFLQVLTKPIQKSGSGLVGLKGYLLLKGAVKEQHL